MDADALARRGFGRRIGFGTAPAILVIDMMRGFTDPELPLGSDQAAEIAVMADVVSAGRLAGAPIYYVLSQYHEAGCRDAGVWRLKQGGISTLVAGTAAVALDERFSRHEDDRFVYKRAASAFFGTDLAPQLVSGGIDTVILMGCTTSGCVRATAVDTVSHGFRPIVVRDGVADRSPSAHQQSLLDLDSKYADVEDASTVIGYLDQSR